MASQFEIGHKYLAVKVCPVRGERDDEGNFFESFSDIEGWIRKLTTFTHKPFDVGLNVYHTANGERGERLGSYTISFKDQKMLNFTYTKEAK